MNNHAKMHGTGGRVSTALDPVQPASRTGPTATAD